MSRRPSAFAFRVVFRLGGETFAIAEGPALRWPSGLTCVAHFAELRNERMALDNDSRVLKIRVVHVRARGRVIRAVEFE